MDHLYDTIPADIPDVLIHYMEDTEEASTISNRENRSLRDIKHYWLDKERADDADVQASDNKSLNADVYDADLEDGLYEGSQLSADQKRCIEYEEMVKVFRPLIVKKVMLHQLLPHLTFVDEVKHRYNLSNKSPEEAMGELLEECIRSHELPKWSIFMSALENSGNSFVVQNIKGYRVIDSSYQEKYLNILKPKLQYMIEVKAILPYLISKNTITDEDKQEIEATEQNKGTIIAANMLLDRVTRKQEFWYHQLLSSFREIGRQDIADYLDIPEMMLPTKERRLKKDDCMSTMGLPKIGCTPLKLKEVSTPGTTLPKRKDLHTGDHASSNADVITDGYETFAENEKHFIKERFRDTKERNIKEVIAPPIPARRPISTSTVGKTESLEKRLQELKLEHEQLQKQQEVLDQITNLEERCCEMYRRNAKYERRIEKVQRQRDEPDPESEDDTKACSYIDANDEIHDSDFDDLK